MPHPSTESSFSAQFRLKCSHTPLSVMHHIIRFLTAANITAFSGAAERVKSSSSLRDVQRSRMTLPRRKYICKKSIVMKAVQTRSVQRLSGHASRNDGTRTWHTLTVLLRPWGCLKCHVNDKSKCECQQRGFLSKRQHSEGRYLERRIFTMTSLLPPTTTTTLVRLSNKV